MYYCLPIEEQGVMFLANGRSVNPDLTWKITDIIDGNLHPSYARGTNPWSDMRNSAIVIVLRIGIVIMLIMGIRSRIIEKPRRTKLKIIMTFIFTALALFSMFELFIYPSIAGSGWIYIFDWNPPIMTIRLFVFPIFYSVTAWYIACKR